MKSAKKKLLFAMILVVISAISLTAFTATAGSGLTLEDIDYTYEGMSSEQAAQIVKAMFGIQDESIVQPRLFCFGNHNLSTGTVTATEHNAYSTLPRCRRTTSFVEYCTRNWCSHFVVTRENVSRIQCC